MRFIIGLLLNAVLFTLSWIVPKKKNTILCGGGMGERFSGNPKYFFLYLHKLKASNQLPFDEYAWITKSTKVYQTLQEQNLPVIDGLSLKGFWKILRSEVLVIESGPAMKKFGHDIGYQRLFMGNFKIVQTWHGSPAKHILLDALKDRGIHGIIEHIYFYLERLELQNFSCILTMGSREQKILQKAFNNPNVKILGYPKNDLLVEGLEAWGYKKEWDNYSKVILYAPTFRETNLQKKPFSLEFFEKLNKILAQRNWIFLIKKHPFDIHLTIPKEYTHIKDVTYLYDDIQVLLAQTDVLISDYSSICVDFLLREKPIVFYTYDFQEYQENSRHLYYDLTQEVPGIKVNTQEELLEVIKSSNDITIDKTQIKQFHTYTDANANQRLLQCIKGDI